MYFVTADTDAPDPGMWGALLKAGSLSPICVTVLPDIFRALYSTLIPHILRIGRGNGSPERHILCLWSKLNWSLLASISLNVPRCLRSPIDLPFESQVPCFVALVTHRTLRKNCAEITYQSFGFSK